MSSLKEGDLSVVASIKEATRLFLKGFGEASESGVWRVGRNGEDEDSICDIFEKCCARDQKFGCREWLKG